METLDTAFRHIADALAVYETRQAQLDLARAVERGMAEGMPTLAEAGTGTGKSFAALVPAILTGKRVVVSTATIALQEQYIHKDLPFLAKALPVRFTAQLVKGRSHYLSKRRWQEYLLAQAASPEIQHWVATTETGDYAELPTTPPAALWEEVRSDKDDCLREQCPHHRECFFFQNRRQLQEAQILVTNHSFLLADFASGRQLLPAYDLVIIDEAHQFPEIATRALTQELSNFALQRIFSRIQKQFNPGLLLHQAEQGASQLFMSLMATEFTSSRRYGADPALVTDLHVNLGKLADHLQELTFKAAPTLEIQVQQMRRDRLVENLRNHQNTLNILLGGDPHWVKWIDYETRQTNTRMALNAAPLEVAGQLRDWFFRAEGPISVWMSATLTTAHADPFAYFRAQIGLPPQLAQELVFESPFDFQSQALLYLPSPPLPEPNDPRFLTEAVQLLRLLLEASEGHALVLFTSSTAMRFCYDSLSLQLPFPCRVQGQAPRRQLLDWFLRVEQPVLFATASFWEGVSIEGSQLRLVVIDRIPFPAPGDPVYDARCELLKSQGGSWFNQLSLPVAALKLKQGAGRLIRTRRDRGVVALLDSRLLRKSYGKQLIQSLPPFKVSSNWDDLVDYLGST